MGFHKVTQILFALAEPCYELREDGLMTVDWLKNVVKLKKMKAIYFVVLKPDNISFL